MKWVYIDVDGVLTDGRVTIDINGNETKSINYRDLDAIGIGRNNGYDFVFVTGEAGDMVKRLANRFTISRVYEGAKDKLAVLKRIAQEDNVNIAEMLYIGDSDRDAPALAAVGLGIAPRDATASAKYAADIITDTQGGYGVLLEVVDKLIAGKLKYPGK